MDFIRDLLVRVALSICLRLFLAEKRQSAEWTVSNFTSLGNSFLFNEVSNSQTDEESRCSPSITSYSQFVIHSRYNALAIFFFANLKNLPRQRDTCIYIYICCVKHRGEIMFNHRIFCKRKEKHSTEANIKCILLRTKAIYELTVFQ